MLSIQPWCVIQCDEELQQKGKVLLLIIPLTFTHPLPNPTVSQTGMSLAVTGAISHCMRDNVHKIDMQRLVLIICLSCK